MPRANASPAAPVDRFFQFSLLGLVASGYLAVAGSEYLDTPTVVLTALALAVRALFLGGVFRYEISERWVTALTLAYIGFFPLDYLFVSGDFVQATVHLVFFVTVVKLLTARSGRDYAFLAAIAFLELLAAAVLSANLNFFVFLALYLLFAMAAFTSSEIRRSMLKPQVVSRAGMRRFHWRLAGLSVFVTAAILSLTAGLFFMLPRTAGSALERLVSRRIFLPGFSNTVTLGQIGKVKTSSEAVMHVDGSVRELGMNAKWRGAALSSFDGKKWFNPPGEGQVVPVGSSRAVVANHRERPGQHVYYQVRLNAVDTDALFFTGSPEVVELRQPLLLRTPDDNYRLGNPPQQNFRYGVYAFLEDTAAAAGAPALPGELRARYLQLPRLDPRIAALARSMAGGAVADADRARAVEAGLRRDYAYTILLPAEESQDPLADFLFARRKGHCEYFASAMTVMLRTLGIPARLVNGFQSGVWNPFTEMYVVRAADAHSWVEAWLPGRGWTTFDPTPPDPNRASVSFWSHLSLYLDAAETFWQEWVLGYDLGRQAVLAGNVQQSGRVFGLRWLDELRQAASRWRAAALAGVRRYGPWTLAAALCFAAAWRIAPAVLRRLRTRRSLRLVRRGQGSTSDATLLYLRMLDVLDRRGYRKPAWFTPGEFASTLPPEVADTVLRFTAVYNGVRFGARLDAAPQLSLLLDRLEGKSA
ncbi:MAG: DUF3488 and DUF4129 domain-containing transglutaminase family protein [Bryobacteraceae bacterium]